VRGYFVPASECPRTPGRQDVGGSGPEGARITLPEAKAEKALGVRVGHRGPLLRRLW